MFLQSYVFQNIIVLFYYLDVSESMKSRRLKELEKEYIFEGKISSYRCILCYCIQEIGTISESSLLPGENIFEELTDTAAVSTEIVPIWQFDVEDDVRKRFGKIDSIHYESEESDGNLGQGLGGGMFIQSSISPIHKDTFSIDALESLDVDPNRYHETR